MRELGFVKCAVAATKRNVSHPTDVGGLGPFCRLAVSADVPLTPGVYAWVVDSEVMYIGMSKNLRQIVQGTRMQRAYNDYTYVPASKAGQVSNPRVRINGLLNRALCADVTVSWWFLALDSSDAAARTEARLIHEWDPRWNRARPTPRDA
jgi:hypothetical protein